MPNGNMTLKRPVRNGRELITIEEVQQLTGLSLNHIRERSSPRLKPGRGQKIRAYKIGIRWWYDHTEVMQDVYGGTPIQGDVLAGLL